MNLYRKTGIASCAIIIVWLLIGFVFNFNGSYFLVLSGFSVLFLMALLAWILVDGLKKKRHLTEASSAEINREDDVLLQGTPFISAILFFYLNLFIPIVDYRKVILGFCIVLFSATFYILRALAKIKKNSEFRFWSSYFMIGAASSFFYEIIFIPLPVYLPYLWSTPFFAVVILAISAIFPFFSISYAAAYYGIRYGIKSKKDKAEKQESKEKEPKEKKLLS